MFCWLLFVLPYFFYCPLCCLFFYDLRILISSLWYLKTFEHSVVGSSLTYGFWLPLWYLQTLDHCVVCPSMYGFWLPLWYLQTFYHCVACPSSMYRFWLPLWYRQTFDRCIVWFLRCIDSGYPFGIFKMFLCIQTFHRIINGRRIFNLLY